MSGKTDPTLGLAVQRHLESLGINTPTIADKLLVSTHERMDKVEHLFAQIMEVLGLDLKDDSLAETPTRVAKMYVKEIFSGLDSDNFPKATTVENKMHYDQMVVEKNITVMSSCEHHFITIAGVAHIAYIPKEKVLGLSKLNRIADYFAKRPQIQERLTQQIGETLKFILETDDVAVVIDASHYCVKARGIRDTSSSTATSFLSGCFRDDPAVRSEFFSVLP